MKPIRSQAPEDAGSHVPDSLGLWRPRNVFAAGAAAEVLGAIVAIATQQREAAGVYVMVFGGLLIAGAVVIKVARFRDAIADGWEEVLWILYRPFGLWHDDPYDAWYACLAGLAIIACLMVGANWYFLPR